MYSMALRMCDIFNSGGSGTFLSKPSASVANYDPFWLAASQCFDVNVIRSNDSSKHQTCRVTYVAVSSSEMGKCALIRAVFLSLQSIQGTFSSISVVPRNKRSGGG